jgi:hypothetical protein
VPEFFDWIVKIEDRFNDIFLIGFLPSKPTKNQMRKIKKQAHIAWREKRCQKLLSYSPLAQTIN